MNHTVEWSTGPSARPFHLIKTAHPSPCTSLIYAGKPANQRFVINQTKPSLTGPLTADCFFCFSYCVIDVVVKNAVFLCLFRSVTLDYEKEIENYGVSSYRFTGTERVFANASDNADNWCFCSGGVCNPSGIGNSSTCRYGAPAFVSFPHFYLADPYYREQVEGLNPQKDLHEFHVDLEPTLAVPSKVRARLQVNVLVEPDKVIE